MRQLDRKSLSLQRLAAVSACVLGLLGAGKTAQAADVIVPGNTDFPESMSGTADGTLYFSSRQIVFRIGIHLGDVVGSAGAITKLQTSRPLYHSDGLRAFGNKLIMVEGETKGNLDLVTVDGDNANIETIKGGFDGPVSLAQVGDQIYVLDVPLRYLLGPEAKDKKAPPAFKASTVPAPKQ